MIATGGVTCAIDFVYQVITVMRRQRDVTTLYCVTFGFSLFIPTLLIGFEGLNGAILSYLIIESILLVLLVWEYFRIRGDLAREAQIRTETEERVRKSFLDLYNLKDAPQTYDYDDARDPAASEAMARNRERREARARHERLAARTKKREDD